MLRGISGTFNADSHFWWQRKEKGERRGRAEGIRAGREVNVFSRMRARICAVYNQQ